MATAVVSPVTSELSVAGVDHDSFCQLGLGSDEQPMLFRRLDSRQEETMGVLHGLLHRERHTYGRLTRYLVQGLEGDENSDHTTEAWRRKICEWIFLVIDHFGFDRELAAIAMSYLDRYSSRFFTEPIKKPDYQLSAIASLFLAVKLHNDQRAESGGRQQLGLPTLVELSRNMFTENMIQKAELQIATALDWQLNPPTALQFITFFLRLLPRWAEREDHASSNPRATMILKLYDTSKYIAELSSFSLALAFDADASIVAYASVLSAISIVEVTTPLPTLVHRAWLQTLVEVDSSFSPFMTAVQMCQQRIRTLCPDIFVDVAQPQLVSPKIEEHKRSRDMPSPTCVQESIHIDCEESPKKRYRATELMEDALPDSPFSV